MKKSALPKKRKTIYIILMLIVIIIGAYTVFIIPASIRNIVPTVQTVFPKKESYTPTVSCKGNIEYSSLNNITGEIPVVIDEYYVATGERVDAGQVIATVDKEKTIEALKSLYGDSTVSVMAQQSGKEFPSQLEASCSGVVFSLAEKGSVISAGSTIASIGSKGDMVLKADVSERFIGKVAIGQETQITVTATDRQYSGTVKEISSCAEKVYSSGVEETVVQITVSIDNPTDELKSGFTAGGKIKTDIPREIVTLPYNAICQDDRGEFVYAFKNGIAIRKDITTGVEMSGCCEVFGISDKDEIIMADDRLYSFSPVIRG